MDKPLDRLRQQYEEYKNTKTEQIKKKYYSSYANMRLFCLDCELVSFSDIELMESDVNNTLIQDSIDVDSWSR